jgi:hypothetical protein
LATWSARVASPTRSLWSPRIQRSPASQTGAGSSGMESSSVRPSAASCAASNRASSSSSNPIRLRSKSSCCSAVSSIRSRP